MYAAGRWDGSTLLLQPVRERKWQIGCAMSVLQNTYYDDSNLILPGTAAERALSSHHSTDRCPFEEQDIYKVYDVHKSCMHTSSCFATPCPCVANKACPQQRIDHRTLRNQNSTSRFLLLPAPQWQHCLLLLLAASCSCSAASNCCSSSTAAAVQASSSVS